MNSPCTQANDPREQVREAPAPESARLPLPQGAVPRRISDTYGLLRRLGSGSMADVYEAEHLRLGKRVAIKLLRPEAVESPGMVARFHREARALAAIANDHVVTVFDCGSLENGTPFLVMELLEGRDLRTFLGEESVVTPRRAANLVLDACRGVGALHDAGIVHRDLKPANLFVTRSASGADRCKVLDLGVAKLLATDTTKQGVFIGTLRYMAPEQLIDGASVGPAADVYALGAILYECLVGTPPHSAPTEPELMFQILNQKPVAPSALVPGLPAVLDGVVLRALDRDPTRRFGSAHALHAALQAAIAELRSRVHVSEEPTRDEPHARDPLRALSSEGRRPAFGASALAIVMCFTQLRADVAPSKGAGAGIPPVSTTASTRSADANRFVDLTGARSAPPAADPNFAIASDKPTKTAQPVQGARRRVVPPASAARKPPPDATAQPLHPANLREFDVANPYSE